MKIYFSCSITGGRSDQVVYKQIVDFLIEKGHAVPTAHLASPDLSKLETGIAPEEIYRRDIDWVRGCDALIAEVSTPSHGVGYEIAEAVNLKKPVLCIYQNEKHVSKIITGNREKNVHIYAYRSKDDLLDTIDVFLCDYSVVQP